MRIWTVISCGDGEAYSAWVTQALAWKNALKLAKKINVRVSKHKNTYADTRVRVETENYEVVVETLRPPDTCQPGRDPPRWENHATVRVSNVELEGDVITAMAMVANDPSG